MLLPHSRHMCFSSEKTRALVQLGFPEKLTSPPPPPTHLTSPTEDMWFYVAGDGNCNPPHDTPSLPRTAECELISSPTYLLSMEDVRQKPPLPFCGLLLCFLSFCMLSATAACEAPFLRDRFPDFCWSLVMLCSPLLGSAVGTRARSARTSFSLPSSCFFSACVQSARCFAPRPPASRFFSR